MLAQGSYQFVIVAQSFYVTTEAEEFGESKEDEAEKCQEEAEEEGEDEH